MKSQVEEAEKSDRYYLAVAMAEAEKALARETYPVGAVIVGPDGEEICRDHNHVYSDDDFTSHAEIGVIRKAGNVLMQERYYQQCTLYTTLEPCFMCCGALLHARIARVVWIKNDDVHGAIRYFKERTDFYDPLYIERFKGLRILHANVADLEKKMDHWMEQWNSMKEEIIKRKSYCVLETVYTLPGLVEATKP